MAFADNLKTIRVFRGKKPADVIKETGIAKAKYYAYEAGGYEPGPGTLDLLAEYFKIKRSLFYEEKLTIEDIMNSIADKRPRAVALIEDPDWVSMQREAWDELKETLSTQRSILTNLSETLKNLTAASTGGGQQG